MYINIQIAFINTFMSILEAGFINTYISFFAIIVAIRKNNKITYSLSANRLVLLVHYLKQSFVQRLRRTRLIVYLVFGT